LPYFASHPSWVQSAGHGRQPVVIPGLGVVGDLRLFPVLLADFHGLFDLGAREHRGGCCRKKDVECQMGGGKKTWKIPETIPRITLTWQKISSNREENGLDCSLPGWITGANLIIARNLFTVSPIVFHMVIKGFSGFSVKTNAKNQNPYPP